MANVLLGVTGSVAALKTPELDQALRQAGFAVKIVATRASLYFFDSAPFLPSPPEGEGRNGGPAEKRLFVDADEWPGEQYRRDDPVLHIDLRRWADLFLIAPLDASTLAKLANGLCDNCLTCVWRAWDPERPVVLAPAMNTLMWEHPLTRRHLRQLASAGDAAIPPNLGQDEIVAWLNGHERRLRVVPPQSKRLACGDVGVGALAALDDIVDAVRLLASEGI